MTAISNHMNKSRRHHYVPQFLTKYFTNDKGKLFTYDKIRDKFYENIPLNLFVENDRNTFLNFEGISDDVIEQIYSSLDNLFAPVLKEIATTNNVSNDHFKLLLFLAYVTKWRVKQYDESFNEAKENFSVDDLGLGFKNSDNKRVDVNLEASFDLDMQQEFKRILLAVQPFRFKEDFKKLLMNSFLIHTPINSFISDCPFNEATIISDEIFEDFVFPVTKDLTLVYSTRIDRKDIQTFLKEGKDENVNLFLKEFSVARDISLLDLAERNVACSDQKYLKHIANIYKKFKTRGTGTPYHLTIFNVLYRYKEYKD